MTEILLRLSHIFCADVFQIYMLGFVLYNLIFLFMRNNVHFQRIKFDSISKLIFPYLTAFYVILYLTLTIYILKHNTQSQHFHNRIFGFYWYTYWMYPIICTIMILISFFNFKFQKILLIVLGILVVLPLERIIILMSSHRDYLPSALTYGNNQGIDITIEILLRCLFSIFIYILLMLCFSHLNRLTK